MLHAAKRSRVFLFSGLFFLPGDIVAVIGLKDTTTGDTLCDPAFPVILEKMDFPEPVIKVAVEPESKKEQDKMTEALMRLAAEVRVRACVRVRAPQAVLVGVLDGIVQVARATVLDDSGAHASCCWCVCVWSASGRLCQNSRQY
jgi:hypothetical protein